ncbi:hypothetical protein NDU88_003902 [Pleurodeles waltl]|uniref:Uncharacterized protein n=1 Tax=Pleurodeles waltl TaxID=8319 RepID=A0AAV7KZT3_PLEWA|nr:hypothetical protein NDU88_003902 [Pleurodeles waltl]
MSLGPAGPGGTFGVRLADPEVSSWHQQDKDTSGMAGPLTARSNQEAARPREQRSCQEPTMRVRPTTTPTETTSADCRALEREPRRQQHVEASHAVGERGLPRLWKRLHCHPSSSAEQDQKNAQLQSPCSGVKMLVLQGRLDTRHFYFSRASRIL